jgi:hypothetical protein
MPLRLLTLLLILTASIFQAPLGAEDLPYDDKHMKVALRMIGHKLLLNSGDSSSRVLPVVQRNESYIIQFESDFSFEPSELVSSVNEIVKQTAMADSYVVEVVDCKEKSIVFSYEVGANGSENIVPCSGRLQPQSCYMIFFTATGSAPGYISWFSNVLNGISDLGLLVYLGIVLLLMAILYLVLRFNRKESAKPVNPNLILLGSLNFDKLNNLLIRDNQQEVLTNKEADLLILLHSEANNTVEREVILNRVWGDDGDYVGRTLDVFISKLRKKLDADSKVKIVNIRGIGYKLVLDVS